MPSSIAHASVAVLLSPALGTRVVNRRLVAVTAAMAAIPDLDAIGRPFGAGDVAVLGGHRAVTHSVFFAILAGTGIAAWSRSPDRRTLLRIGGYAALVVLSHGILDAFATYGEGVAFFAPLSDHRWKFGWPLFSGILAEVVLVWLPAVAVFQLWLKPRLDPGR